MIAEIITIGDEILIGQIVDTNSAFLGKELNKIGVDVHQVTSIRDDKEHILQAMSDANDRVDIVIMTGGLGPTKDDITKHTICEYFDDQLIQNDAVLLHIEKLFREHIKVPMVETNRMQALVPQSATVLMNNYGTAPGMWLEKNDTVFISMPGVPFEMKHLVKDQVLPRLQKKFDRPYIIHKTVLTYGLGESLLAKKIETWEDSLPAFIKLAYLPNLGKVRLRLSAKGMDKQLLEESINSQIKELHEIIEEYIVGYEDGESLESKIGTLLVEKNKTLAVAESCTGGKISHLLTSKEGASSYYKGGLVAYATQSKIDILGVDSEIIEKSSVTSKEVAEAMALAVKKKFASDYAISTTGNAGPSKGDGTAVVGTVFIGIATPDGVFSKEFTFSKNRERTIDRAVSKSLELLLRELFS